MTDPAERALPVLAGVPLVQYASVTAAIAEGLPLDEVLAIEGLPPKAWAEAKLAWKARIVKDSMTSGDVFEAYGVELAAAEDRLTRKVAPLDDDVAAWVGFLKAYAASPTPFDLLDRVGLGLNDVARLERRWSRRIDEDTALQKRVAELRKRPAGELPKITAEPPRVERSPAAGVSPAAIAAAAKARKAAGKVAQGAPVAGLEIEGMSLDRYASLCADLEAAPRDEERVLGRHGLSAGSRAALDRGWRERLAGSPELEQDFRRLLAHAKGRSSARARAAETPRAAPEARPEPAPPVPAAPSYLRAATVAIDAPAAESLPFRPAAAPERALENAIAHAEAVQGPAAPNRAASGGTVDIGALIAAEPPAAGGAQEDPARPEEGSRRAATVALDAPPPGAAELPFRPAPEPSPSVALPQFTLEQYASLCVEIALGPDRVPHTLIRYHLTPESRALLDAHFRGRFAADPAQRAAFAQAFAAYKAIVTDPARQRR